MKFINSKLQVLGRIRIPQVILDNMRLKPNQKIMINYNEEKKQIIITKFLKG